MPVTYYSQDDIEAVLSHIRKDLSEIYHLHKDGTRHPVSQVEAQDNVLVVVAQHFGINLNEEQPEDEIDALKRRVAQLERERQYVPLPYPVYPVNPYPLSPVTYEYKVVCSGGTLSVCSEGMK